MPIDLPTSPAPREFHLDLVSASNVLRPGSRPGPSQKLNRTGSHWVATVAMPGMSYTEAMAWLARLRAEADTLVLAIEQPGFNPGSPGTPRLKGGGQLGNAMLVDGLTPGYQGKEGQFLSAIIDGHRFAYEIRADFTVPGTGEYLIPVQPLIRRSLSDNAVVEIAAPKIEGYVSLPDGAGKITVDRLVAGLTFMLEERE